MSAFYIGQPVKKTRGPANIGISGIVVELGVHPLQPMCDMKVRAACAAEATSMVFGTKIVTPPGHEGWTDSSLWEPILPPGLESPAEIAALYEPEDAIA